MASIGGNILDSTSCYQVPRWNRVSRQTALQKLEVPLLLALFRGEPIATFTPTSEASSESESVTSKRKLAHKVLHRALLMRTSKRLVGPIRRLLTACDGCVLASGELFLAPIDHVCSSKKPAILTVVCHRYPRCSLGRPSTGRQWGPQIQ